MIYKINRERILEAYTLENIITDLEALTSLTKALQRNDTKYQEYVAEFVRAEEAHPF